MPRLLGSPVALIHDPARLVRAGRMIVVTVNYRLGVFGFVPHPRLGRNGDLDRQDQLAALRWVRANTARFGGDPRRITPAGESVDAMSVCSPMTAPAGRDRSAPARQHPGRTPRIPQCPTSSTSRLIPR
ncbi:carboxylesterase family protein [Streptomyces sp. NPDC003077]|uniref:carboxylesterase family protein n=1 Tax=Streptomyces sp. NPDC003077 TaxID=3154443 RepID=UPI00339FE4B2